MKKTTLEEDYEYFGHIFSKEEIMDCYKILEKEGILIKTAKYDEYIVNELKLRQIAKDYDRKVKYGK